MATTPRLRFLKKQGIEVKQNNVKKLSDDDGNKANSSGESEKSEMESDDEEKPKQTFKHGLSDDDSDDPDEPLLKISKRDVFKDIEPSKV